MGLLSSSSNKHTTNNFTENTATQVTGGQGALSGNTGSIRYNYSETDHGAIKAGLDLGTAGVGAVVDIARQSYGGQQLALTTLAGAFSRQHDRLDANANLVEVATKQTTSAVQGMLALGALVGVAVYFVRR